MPLPLILIGIGVATGGTGLGVGGWGASDIVRARTRIRSAGDKYDTRRSAAEAAVTRTNRRLKALGEQQQEAVSDVVVRMANFLRRHEQQVRDHERLLVDGVDTAMQEVPGLGRLNLDASSWLRGVVGSAATGAGVSSGVTTAVATYATASTGTAISGLSGAAATNATLAALGGGALAEGGGGMALGATVLNVVTIGPALLVGGSILKAQGSKALTQAREAEAKVSVAIAELDTTIVTLDAVITRASELSNVLQRLRARAVESLELLESEPFQPDTHAERFQRAMTLVVAVRDIAATPIVDSEGELTQKSATLTIKYRAMEKD